jgi:hypothetical protein
VFSTAAAVDRLWSITPGLYTAIMVRGAILRALAGQTTPSDERQLVMLALVVAWCCRWASRLGGAPSSRQRQRPPAPPRPPARSTWAARPSLQQATPDPDACPRAPAGSPSTSPAGAATGGALRTTAGA